MTSLDDFLKKENFKILVVNGCDPIDRNLHEILAEKGYKTTKMKMKRERQRKAVLQEIATNNYNLILMHNKQFVPEYAMLYAAAGIMSAETEAKPEIGFMMGTELGIEKVYEAIRLAHARRFYRECKVDNTPFVEEIAKTDPELVICARMHVLQDAIFQGPKVMGKLIVNEGKESNMNEIEFGLVDAYLSVKKRYEQNRGNEALTRLVKLLEGTYSILFEKNLETSAKDFYNAENLAQRVKKESAEKELKVFKLEDHMLNSKGLDKLVFESIGFPIYNHALFIVQQKQDNYLAYDVVMEDGNMGLGSGEKVEFMDFIGREVCELKKEDVPSLINKAKADKYLSVVIVRDLEPNELDKKQKIELAYQAYIRVKKLFLTKMGGG